MISLHFGLFPPSPAKDVLNFCATCMQGPQELDINLKLEEETV